MTASEFKITCQDFASTEATIAAQTELGKSLFAQIFGQGAVSVSLPKSKGLDFADFAKRKGLSVE